MLHEELASSFVTFLAVPWCGNERKTGNSGQLIWSALQLWVQVCPQIVLVQNISQAVVSHLDFSIANNLSMMARGAHTIKPGEVPSMVPFSFQLFQYSAARPDPPVASEKCSVNVHVSLT